MIARALREHLPNVAVLPSSAHLFHDYLASGWQFDGAISGSFNYAMEPMLAHIEAFERLDLKAAREIWNGGMAQLHEYVYSEPGRLHVRYKIATWLRGLIDSPLMRAPMPRPARRDSHAGPADVRLRPGRGAQRSRTIHLTRGPSP